jgi:hypothetical protein
VREMAFVCVAKLAVDLGLDLCLFKKKKIPLVNLMPLNYLRVCRCGVSVHCRGGVSVASLIATRRGFTANPQKRVQNTRQESCKSLPFAPGPALLNRRALGFGAPVWRLKENLRPPNMAVGGAKVDRYQRDGNMPVTSPLQDEL